MRSLAAAPLLALLALPAAARSAPRGESLDAAEIALALRKLNVLGSVLYVAAHPDDENTSLLAYLEGERGVRAAYLSVTRGDGGQNLIGSEQSERLGVLRTQELLAARRIDGAEQRFTSAIDFGYSKRPEETLETWGRDAALADVVWIFRTFRPDVVINRFPTDGGGGHGHHTASAILAEEAFRAAGDPARFPEQLAAAPPWRPKRLLWNAWRPPGSPDGSVPKLRVDVGAFSPLLGKSYTEIAGESRSQHKSQGFGAPERRGTRFDGFQLVAGDPADADPLEGVDLTWARVPGGDAVRATIDEAIRAFDAARPDKVLPLLLKAHAQLDELGNDPWVAVKRADLLEVIRGAAGLWVEAVAPAYAASPGETVPVSVTVVNRSGFPMQLERIDATHAPASAPAPIELEANRPRTVEVAMAIPADAPFTGPYWLDRAPEVGRFHVSDPALVGRPDSVPPLHAKVTLRAGGRALVYEAPVIHRWVDPVRGEQRRPFEISPKVTIDLGAKVFLFPAARPREAQVTVRSTTGPAAGTLRLAAPPEWKVEPASQPFALKAQGDDAVLAFTITPPAAAAAATLKAEAEVDGVKLSRGLARIDHPHVPVQTLFPPAEAKLVRADVAAKGKSVGYVAGAGDDVAEAIAQLGLDVTPLDDDDLERADLERFDAIVTGVRAFNTRASLKHAVRRLHRFVEKGGTLVVQYNTLQELVTAEIGPYPFQISRDRVTVESAPVKLLNPSHALLRVPNAIGEGDFAGWVQERGLYFAGKWDPHYEPLLAMADPGEGEKHGALLHARHGRGVFIFTGLALFRQLPAGVPGAYRLLANCISARLVHD